MNFRKFQFRNEMSFFKLEGSPKKVSWYWEKMKLRKNTYTISSGTMVIGSHTFVFKCQCPMTVSSVCVLVWCCNQVTCNCPDLSHTYSFWEQSSSLFSLSKQAHISHWWMSHSWHNEQIKTVWPNWIVSEEQRTLQSKWADHFLLSAHFLFQGWN